MKIELILEGKYYHIYNNGVNGIDIFQQDSDYFDFLTKYQLYMERIVETFAYSLLKNHFHLLLFTKKNVIVERDDGKGLIRLTASKQLGHFFNAYAQKFNVGHNRTGSLFESPFRRKLITNQTQLKEVIRYINRNA